MVAHRGHIKNVFLMIIFRSQNENQNESESDF